MQNLRFPIGDAVIELPAKIVADALIAQLQFPSRRTGVPAIGEPWPGQGGIYAGDIRGDDGAVYGLIVSDKDADDDDIQWGGYGTDIPAAASTWDGLSNTAAMVTVGAYPAAQYADGFECDGHKDYYLPAKRELQIAAANLPHLFEKTHYWSSTQSGPSYAWAVGFEYGYVGHWRKDGEFRVRPFRRFIY